MCGQQAGSAIASRQSLFALQAQLRAEGLEGQGGRFGLCARRAQSLQPLFGPQGQRSAGFAG